MQLTDIGFDAVDPARPSARAAPWLVRRVLRYVERGGLTITLPSGALYSHVGSLPGAHGRITLHRWRALLRLLGRGDVGFADGYIAGDWSSPDLVSLIAVLASNITRLDPINEGFWATRLWRRVRHLGNRNSARGSRRNIAFHYDLGNAFYRLWLDPTMTYSSAMALAPGQSLASAQAAKLAHIADLLALTGHEKVLEIGCGWGELALRLSHDAASVIGLTLSQEQLAWARERVSAAGQGGCVDLRLQDYRTVTGQFDRIVSIEMLEAVGEAYWPAFFQTLRDRLAPGGRIVLQAITIRDDRFAAYKRSPDFIQRYIFPGGMLPTRAILAEEAARAGLAMTAAETFAMGYAETLAAWRRNFDGAWPQIETLGFAVEFRRLWTYYLAYCEAGFRTGTIDVGLYTLVAAGGQAQ